MIDHTVYLASTSLIQQVERTIFAFTSWLRDVVTTSGTMLQHLINLLRVTKYSSTARNWITADDHKSILLAIIPPFRPSVSEYMVLEAVSVDRWCSSAGSSKEGQLGSSAETCYTTEHQLSRYSGSYSTPLHLAGLSHIQLSPWKFYIEEYNLLSLIA